ncbi:hypothetical protein KPH14_003059 [Odynerus spinipes]|uniref:Uncharacterized protein n=1 Tax=Odynerus spinipes TaxID=1348599 RepID=A0AAD9VV74_9HYME|nr:hypothetical protein KPH14_003059 [Odynerus spinipes]
MKLRDRMAKDGERKLTNFFQVWRVPPHSGKAGGTISGNATLEARNLTSIESHRRSACEKRKIQEAGKKAKKAEKEEEGEDYGNWDTSESSPFYAIVDSRNDIPISYGKVP